MGRKVAVIIGAGPAGLTAAYELLKRTAIKPIVFEAEDSTGGISKTIPFFGNRIDIGPHRFFSKSDRVLNFWKEIIPTQREVKRGSIYSLYNNICISERNKPEMLICKRITHILFQHKFFDYPISLNWETINNLGIERIIKSGLSYLHACIIGKKHKNNTLEDFFISRFGKEFYYLFFKDYTEKVWGVSCREISPDWGIQRVKGLSVTKLLHDVIKNSKLSFLVSKETERSLIREFMYPKLGAGQMWEETAAKIVRLGGAIYTQHQIVTLKVDLTWSKVTEVLVYDKKHKKIWNISADYVFSTMPVKDLIYALFPPVPTRIKDISSRLTYRSLITVGLLITDTHIRNNTKIKTYKEIIPDNWIYIQDKHIKMGRVIIFNNWSPCLLEDINKVLVGVDYFCSEGDDLWMRSNREIITLCIEELKLIELIKNASEVEKTIVVRTPKAYPAYFGGYKHFGLIREFTDQIKNLFLIGRNGMHRYNNQDHSMLSAMVAVDNIVNGLKSKDNIWSVNTDSSYHEEKS